MCSQDRDLFDLQELNANKKRHAYLFQLITSFVSPLFTFFWAPQRAQLSPPPSNHILGTCAASQFLIYMSRTNNTSRMVLWYLLCNEEILNYRKLENNPIVNGQWSGDLKTWAPLCTFLPSCVFLKVGDMAKQLLNSALVLLACRKMFHNKRRSPSLISSSGQYTMFLWPVLFTAVLQIPLLSFQTVLRLPSPSVSHDALHLIPRAVPLIPAPQLFLLLLLVLHLPCIYANYPKVMSWPGISDFASLGKTESETDIRIRKCLFTSLFSLPAQCPVILFNFSELVSLLVI